MRYEITYCSIQSDHMLATPRPHSSEVVECKDSAALDRYILRQKDRHGRKYKKATWQERKTYGFDYISGMGAVKVKPVTVKKI